MRRSKSTRAMPVETFHTSSKVLDAMRHAAEVHPRDPRPRQEKWSVMWKWRFSAIRSARAGGKRIVRRSYRFGERDPRRAQQDEKFTGPK
jgi:hypothetical protein